MSHPPSCIHGTIINSIEVGSFILTETVYAAHFRIPTHLHLHACFYTVLQGSLTETFGTTTLEAKASSLIFRPAGEQHSDQVHNTSARCFLIEIKTGWLEQVRDYATFFNTPMRLQSSWLSHLAMRLRRESYQQDVISPVAVEGITLEIYAEACRERIKARGAGHPRWLKEVKELLHERFLEPLTIASIAESVGLHPVYLNSVFRRYTRCSLGEYQRRLRVEFACRRISETDVPLAQVALEAGYADQPHFSRTFKRLTGMTPTEYRANTRPSLSEPKARLSTERVYASPSGPAKVGEARFSG